LARALMKNCSAEQMHQAILASMVGNWAVRQH